MLTRRALALAALLGCALFVSTRPLPPPLPRPVIYATEAEARAAMRSAPFIVVVRITDLALTGDQRTVERPAGDSGQPAWDVPLSLARIQADVQFTLRGPEFQRIEFYSWVWTSGKHGGPRLFHPTPGSIRALFLRDENGLLHTVGDYPSYDLELRRDWIPAMLAGWQSGLLKDAEPADRLTALRLQATFEPLTEPEIRKDFGPGGNPACHFWAGDLCELARLSGMVFVSARIDDLCLRAANPSTRFAACFIAAQYVPARCTGYHLAQQDAPAGFDVGALQRHAANCVPRLRRLTDRLVSARVSRQDFFSERITPEQRRETLRIFATAYDPAVRRAACALAAASPEMRGLPECAPPSAPALLNPPVHR